MLEEIFGGRAPRKRRKARTPVTDPLARIWRSERRSSGPPSTLLLAAALPKSKSGEAAVDLLDALEKEPQAPPARRKSKPKERMSLTSWAVNGFQGALLGQPKAVQGSAAPVTKLRKRHAIDPLRRDEPVEEEMSHKLSSFVPLSVLERKPMEIPFEARRSRKSSAKPRPSAAVGGANRGRWLENFRRYLYDGEIHSDDLPRALLHCGFEESRAELVSKVLARVAEYNTLDEEEFLDFMAAYEEEVKQEAARSFERSAAGGGLLPQGLLTRALAELELKPRRRLLEELELEVCGESRAEGLSLPEFHQVVELLRSRRGFLRDELEHFRAVFQVFDRDQNGGMSVVELSSALAWLGFPITGSLPSLHQRHDVDNKGVLTESEFLRLLRTIYEEEAAVIEDRLQQLPQQRCRNGAELADLLLRLGYTATVDMLLDALQAQNLCKGYVRSSQLLRMPFEDVEVSLSCQELQDLTATLRAQDGFSDEEMEEVRIAFHAQAKEEAEIATPAIQRALRYLGHIYCFDFTQQLVSELDVDGDAHLDFTLFVKLIRKCRDRDRHEAAAAFFELDRLDTGFLDSDQQLAAFQRLGVKAEAEAPMRLQRFLKIVQSGKSSVERLRLLREKEFFEVGELEQLWSFFKSFDRDDNDELKHGEVVSLIETLFPRHANLPELRPYFTDLLCYADVNRNEGLGFDEFVRLMRKIREDEEEFQFELYKEALEELEFTSQETSEFRGFFLERAVGGKIAMEVVYELISESFKLKPPDKQRLWKLCSEAMEGEEDMNFLAFLHVMRQVLDIGWTVET